MVAWMAREPRLEIVVLDNASTYPPLLEWYAKDCPVEVVRLDRDVGCRAPWDTGLVAHRKGNEPYIVTDPDLDLAGIPEGWLDVLQTGIDYPGITKCGFSLAVADLPMDVPQYEWVKSTQAPCWNDFDADLNHYCRAGVDTTFALYRTDASRRPRTTNLRSKPPFTARHLPWYVKPCEIPDDFLWFLQRASLTKSIGSTLTREFGQALIGQK